MTSGLPYWVWTEASVSSALVGDGFPEQGADLICGFEGLLPYALILLNMGLACLRMMPGPPCSARKVTQIPLSAAV